MGPTWRIERGLSKLGLGPARLERNLIIEPTVLSHNAAKAIIHGIAEGRLPTADCTRAIYQKRGEDGGFGKTAHFEVERDIPYIATIAICQGHERCVAFEHVLVWHVAVE